MSITKLVLIFCVFSLLLVGSGIIINIFFMNNQILKPTNYETSESGLVEINILLDTSGSMSDSIDGQEKIVIAKELFRNFLISNNNANIGVRTFGGSCESNILFPIGNYPNKQILIEKVNSLKAMGSTPIELALNKAKNDFKNSGKKAIILISDGKETCYGDPCKVAKELSKLGISAIYTVGFDIAEDGVQDLKCIAESTGGKYFEAKNKQQLINALNQSYNEIIGEKDCLNKSNIINRYLCYFTGGRM